MSFVVSVLTFLAGLLVLTGGAHWFVNGAVRLAEWMRVSRLLVGLTVVAFGTSSPELFLDTVAAMRGATSIARAIGMSDLVIGLTIVAIGTSLPELATALAASWREESDISIGNVLGSNVFKILFIMGLVAQISPLPVRTESLQVDLPMMFGVVVLFGVLVARGMRLSRVGGAILLCAYVTYLCIKIF